MKRALALGALLANVGHRLGRRGDHDPWGAYWAPRSSLVGRSTGISSSRCATHPIPAPCAALDLGSALRAVEP